MEYAISTQRLFAVLQLCYRLGEGPLEDFVDVLTVAGRAGEVLEAPFLGVGDRLALLDLLGPAVVFVAHQDHHCFLEAEAVALHGGLPLPQPVEALPVFEVEDEEDHLSPLEERVADVFVVGAAGEVEEVDGHLSARDVDLLDPVVDPDGRDVLLHKTALAVTLDYAGLSGASVSHRYQLSQTSAYLQQNLMPLHRTRFSQKYQRKDRPLSKQQERTEAAGIWSIRNGGAIIERKQHRGEQMRYYAESSQKIIRRMQNLEGHELEIPNNREALSEVQNRARVRKHTVYINGKERVAFLEKIANSKLVEAKEPELIFLINPESPKRA